MFLEKVILFIVSKGALLVTVHKNDRPTLRLTHFFVIMGYNAISLICSVVIREGVPRPEY